MKAGDWIILANIKPCPFCGGKPTLSYNIVDWMFSKGWKVFCSNVFCEIQPGTMDFAEPEHAVSAWVLRGKKNTEK